MQLKVGKEYKSVDTDFLSGVVTKETNLIYLGLHPYDDRHMFASELGGCVYIPKNGLRLDVLEAA